MLILRLISVCLLFATVPVTAWANEVDGSEVDAATQDLIQEGILLRQSGKDEAALAIFLETEKRSPHSVRVLLHITTAAQATGRWVLAYEYLQRAAAHSDDPYYQKHRSSIQTVEQTLAQRLGKLRVVGSPAGAEILLNGQRLGVLPLAEPIVIEAGSYTLEVKNNGYFSVSRPINIAAGLSLTQEAITLNASAPPTTTTVVAAAPTPGSPRDRAPEPPPARWLTWTLAGTSLGLLATSGVAFLIRESKANQWNDEGRCLDPEQPNSSRSDLCGDLKRDVKLAEGIGIASGVVGLVLAGAAVLHFSLDGAKESDATARADGCGVGFGNVMCRGTF